MENEGLFDLLHLSSDFNFYLQLNIVHSLYLEPSKLTCSSWKEATGWSCQNGGDWTELDGSLGISQTAECELLCRQQLSNGCCELSDSYGCYWKISAEVSSSSSQSVLAVACVVSGILFLN